MIYHTCFAQKENALFKKLPLDSLGVRCYEMLFTIGGSIRLTTSLGICKIKGHLFEMPNFALGRITDNITGHVSYIKNFSNGGDSTTVMAEGSDSIFVYNALDNTLFYSPNSDIPDRGNPPFVFPPKGQPFDKISTLFIDNIGDLFIGTQADNFYWIKEGANKQSFYNSENKIVDSMVVVVKGEKRVNKIILAPQTAVFSFAQDSTDKNIIWVGTNHGLYSFNKLSGESKIIVPVNMKDGPLFTVTHIETDKQSNLWFSTMEKGMGFYYKEKNSIRFYPYPKKNSIVTTLYPIKRFSYKSGNDFYVAVLDSLPAVFNTKSGAYAFIDDPSFTQSVNNTTDIKVDKLGNLFVIKGGALYQCKTSENSMLASALKIDSSLLAPFIRSVSLQNGTEIASINYKPELLQELQLKYNENSFIIYYDLNDFGDKSKIHFAWKMDGYTDTWVVMPTLNVDDFNIAFFQNLKPGKYVFELKVKVGSEGWRQQQTRMIIIISPPFWQTWWFWLSAIAGVCLILFAIVKWRVSVVRKQERIKASHEKEVLELEAKALRAQMNPHFIFNCMNSIKSLIQQKEEDKAINYLTTFSKLIRTIFQNSDKREITLYDEMETCRLYTQLESMRFGDKFSYHFNIDETIDMKSVRVPALVIQPFIENAIWHGIMPKEKGGILTVTVEKKEEAIYCIIDDDGIGRELSKQNKFRGEPSTHQSKGVHLTQNRLDLDNLLNERNATIILTDKKDNQDKATGTTVVLTFKEY
ncbi:MAG: histidine kinase [Ferruginibacter sp.]